MLKTVVDTISAKPEIGIFASVFGVAMSPTDFVSLLSASFGLIVVLITLVIKAIDLWRNIRGKKKEAVAPPEKKVVINGQTYKLDETPPADDIEDTLSDIDDMFLVQGPDGNVKK